MWRSGEPKVAESKASEVKVPDAKVIEQRMPVTAAAPPRPAVGPGAASEQATLGSTMTVKGELTGAQALYVDGRVEGTIRFPEHRVTVGRSGIVLANIEAKEVVIMGSVTGNIECGDRVDIRADAVFTGDVATRRISIDEGALVKGKVEVWRGKVREQGVTEAGSGVSIKNDAQGKAAAASDSAKAAAAASGTASRVAGSSVMFEETKGGAR